METYFEKHPRLKDVLNLGLFILLVALGTVFINTFIFRSFNVQGPSMETTYYTGDRLIVNRLPITFAQLRNTQYVPNRGDIIVFKNPRYVQGQPEEYIVKRVLALPGERVKVKDGTLTVFNNEHPDGFEPDQSFHKNGAGPGSPTYGEIDTTVADDTVFVAGDHRRGNCSYDSRVGMGTIPFFDIIGPVGFRMWPLPGVGKDRSADSADRTTTCESSDY